MNPTDNATLFVSIACPLGNRTGVNVLRAAQIEIGAPVWFDDFDERSGSITFAVDFRDVGAARCYRQLLETALRCFSQSRPGLISELHVRLIPALSLPDGGDSPSLTHAATALGKGPIPG